MSIAISSVRGYLCFFIQVSTSLARRQRWNAEVANEKSGRDSSFDAL